MEPTGVKLGIRTFGTAISCAALFACSQDPGPDPVRNAILITIDTASADVFGCFGGPQGLTPYIDDLATRSLRFTQARSVAPLTLPSHASMLTGLYPPRHRLRDNGLRALPSAASTLAEQCRAAGLETAAFVSSAVLDPAFGLDQGFDVYNAPVRSELLDYEHQPQRSAAETAQEARWWLNARNPSKPFFLWVHFYDPHVPYDPPRAFLDLTGDAYLGEIARVDQAVGELLEPLRVKGTLDTTLTILATDHGESLGAHKEPTHGAFCYDATMHVLLLVDHPAAGRAGDAADRLVSVVDVYPTVLAALGLEAREGLDGLDLMSKPTDGRGVYFESYSGFINYGWSPLAGWMDEDGKYLHSSKPEFFRWREDRHEQKNRYGEEGVDVARYQRAISELFERPPIEDDSTGGHISEDLLADLRMLGYGAIGTEVLDLPHPLDPTERLSPWERAGELSPLLTATALGQAQRYEEAVLLLRKIVDENPEHGLAIDLLSFDLMQVSRFEEARELLEWRVRSGRRRADTRINLAVCCEKTGDVELAETWFERALELDPNNVQALTELVRLSSARGDEAAAEGWRIRLTEAQSE